MLNYYLMKQIGLIPRMILDFFADFLSYFDEKT